MEPHLMKNQFAPFFRSTEVATKINKMLNEEPVEIGENPINFGIVSVQIRNIKSKFIQIKDRNEGPTCTCQKLLS